MDSDHQRLCVLSSDRPEPTASCRPAFAIMSKAPRAGEVKTRLTPPLTPEEAAALNACFLRDMAAAIAQAAGGGQGIACYTPVGTEEIFAELLPHSFQLLAQRAEHLTDRLINATHDLFAIGFQTVCLCNSDSPTVPATTFAEAADVLAEAGDRVVLGPSDDGGYYLVGLKQPHPRIFQEIDWSTSRVLEQTMERAAELDLPVHLLPAGYDVDDRMTLHRLCRDLLGPNEQKKVKVAPATEAFLRRLVDGEGWERLSSGASPAFSIS